MIMKIHNNLLKQWCHTPMGQFHATIFLMSITSLYVRVSEVLKNLSFKSQLFSFFQKNLPDHGHPNSTRRPKYISFIKKNFFWDGVTNNILFIWLSTQKQTEISDLILLHCLQDYKTTILELLQRINFTLAIKMFGPGGLFMK